MKYIVGIDEVGRGPLAGPVTVGVVACEARQYALLKRDKKLPKFGKDSKKLSATQRDHYATILKRLSAEGKILYAVTHAPNTIIDKKGISFAIKKAMAGGMKKIKINPKNCDVRLDGSLRAPIEFKKQKTIIKGDEKEKIIAWASILAKVYRDTLMRGYAKCYLEYGFDRNAGYGTKTHRSAISKYGLSALHRKSFCKKFLTFKSN